MVADVRDPYAVLGVPVSASDDVVRRAYRRTVRACHPDTGARPDPELLATAVWARDLLCDPERRATFDAACASTAAQRHETASDVPFDEQVSAAGPPAANSSAAGTSTPCPSEPYRRTQVTWSDMMAARHVAVLAVAASFAAFAVSHPVTFTGSASLPTFTVPMVAAPAVGLWWFSGYAYARRWLLWRARPVLLAFAWFMLWAGAVALGVFVVVAVLLIPRSPSHRLRPSRRRT